MSDIDQIIQRIRQLAESFEVAPYPATRAVLDNSTSFRQILKTTDFSGLKTLIHKSLEGYWPKMRPEFQKLGIWWGCHEARSGYLIAQAMMDVLVDRRAVRSQGKPGRRAPSPLYEAVKNGIDQELEGKRLWEYVDLQARQNQKIKPIPGWREVWPGTFTKAYRGGLKSQLNNFAYRARKSLSRLSD